MTRPATARGQKAGATKTLPSAAKTVVRVSRYLLRLYVTGTTAGSIRAIQQVRRVCDEHLEGRYDLEVIDIYQLPALAKNDQIIATPTLVKVLPAPLRRLIGDFSNLDKVLFGMDIRERA